MPKRPPEIEAALDALETLSTELSEGVMLSMKKALPTLARQMAQAGENVNASTLIDHVRQGEGHMATLKEKYSQKPKAEALTYEGVIDGLTSQDTQLGLIKAVKDNNFDEIKRIGIEDQENYFHAMHQAVGDSNLDMVKFLSEFDPDRFNQHLILHLNREIQLAQENSCLEIIKYLLDNVSDISISPPNPFHGWAKTKNKEIPKFLITCKQYDGLHNLDVNLRIASQHGLYDIVELLIEKGADVKTDCNDPMELALGNGHWDIVYLLQKHGADIALSKSKLTQGVAKSGGAEEIKILNDNFPDFDLIDFFAQSIFYGNLDAIQHCLDEDVDYKRFSYIDTSTGTTNHPFDNALNVASRGNQKHVCLFFKDYDPEFYKASLTGALAVSGQEKHTDMTRFLIEEGANVSAPNLWILRDYICSNISGDYETIKFLVENGADVNANGGEALRLAAGNRQFQTVKLLVENGAKAFSRAPTEIGYGWWGKNIDITDYLLDKNVLDWPLMAHQQEKLDRYRDWKTRFPDVNSATGLYNLHHYHFDDDTYKAAAEMLKKEGYEHDDYYSYNVACLFKSEQRVLQYLQKWGEAGKQPLHDIIQDIRIPQDGRPDLKAWGDAVLKHGPKMARFVKFADRLAQPAKDGSGGWSYTKTKEEMAKHAYKRGAENPKLASFCLEHAWDDDDFDDALKQIKKFKKKYSPSDLPEAANDNIKGGAIPDIAIDGKEFGKEGYTFRKLPDGDVRGLLLGEFTNCCQHLASQGRDCAKHGFLSKNGGFYVVEDNKSGDIVGQAWAWRGKKGELVFDSLESLSGHFNAEKWLSLCTAFSEKVRETLKETNITAFYVGKGGATPDIGFDKAETPAKPIDYDGYRDSKKQYAVKLF